MMKHNKIKTLIIMFCIVIAFLFIMYVYKIINEKYNIGIPCIFHEITNLYCPGCGITRAFFSLIELNIKTALKCNLLIFIMLPFLLAYIVTYIYYKISNIKRDASQIFSKKTWYALLIISILFGILRNINYFHWLRPI